MLLSLLLHIIACCNIWGDNPLPIPIAPTTQYTIIVNGKILMDHEKLPERLFYDEIVDCPLDNDCLSTEEDNVTITISCNTSN